MGSEMCIRDRDRIGLSKMLLVVLEVDEDLFAFRIVNSSIQS